MEPINKVLFNVEIEERKLTARQANVFNSPKRDGNCDIDSIPFLKELDIQIENKSLPIQFSPNINESIHRWAPYVQGFSASFVQSVFEGYKHEYENPIVLDPFAGCGTVLVQAKFNGYESYGTELNPLLQFISSVKLNSWQLRPEKLLKTFNNLPKNKYIKAPSFLKSDNQFHPAVLKNLEIIKGGIDALEINTIDDIQIKNLLWLAFSSILIDCSHLKRSPCLGYTSEKKVKPSAPFVLMNQKVHNIAEDLSYIQLEFSDFLETKSDIYLANAMDFRHQRQFDLVITSPPYMNGLDYVINYKIEMGWLDFVHNQKELKRIKDSMVVCDNVSKGLIREFTPIYTNSWIEEIKENIEEQICKRGTYRRLDMPYIVHKYFDDMYKVMKGVVEALNINGRIVLVVGDSLIADVYIPTDLLIAKIGEDLGLRIEKIEKARERRSGQIRSYKLRETIITLKK